MLIIFNRIMEIFMKHIYTEKTYLQDFGFIDSIFTEDTLFFDIETTGFSRSASILYLIGCMHRKGNLLIIEQFLAESKEDEKELLLSFQKLLCTKQTLISFHGLGFDVPFLNAKYNGLKLEASSQNETHTSKFTDICLNKYPHLDIFKEVKQLQSFLRLPDYKQKTIESFLESSREDTFHGGELIPIYEAYQKTHDTQLEHLLLLHNFEDILGMLDLLPILTYKEILKGAFDLENTQIFEYSSYEGEQKKEYIITLKNHFCVPKQISCQYADYYVTMYKETTKIRIPIVTEELRFFFPNYKDYFYLPKEDMAIHKSVADFVDKQYRQKAKAWNCYTRRTSLFLPQYDTIITPVFRREYKDTCCYFEYNEAFSASRDAQLRYIQHIFGFFLK